MGPCPDNCTRLNATERHCTGVNALNATERDRSDCVFSLRRLLCAQRRINSLRREKLHAFSSRRSILSTRVQFKRIENIATYTKTERLNGPPLYLSPVQ